MHVQDKTKAAGDTVTDHILLAEYLTPYDPGGFRVGRAAFHTLFPT
jgi:hypothetical protein